MVVTLTNLLNLSSLETKAMNLIERLDLRETLKKHSAQVITKVARQKLNIKNYGHEDENLNERISYYLEQVKTYSRHLREASDDTSMSEELHLKFGLLNSKMEELEERQDSNKELMIEIAKKMNLDVSKFEKKKLESTEEIPE